MAARVAVDVTRAPWAVIGRVQTTLGVRCTGFALAPRVVMTAAHCLWVPATSRFIAAPDVHVLMAYDHGRYKVHAQALLYRIGREDRPVGSGPDPREDYAALVLDRPVVTRDQVLPHIQPHAGQAAALAGYQQDRDEVLMGDLSCHVLAVSGDGLIRHDCAGTHGASGAPLLVRSGDGWAIAGLATSAEAGQGGTAVFLPR